MKTIERYSIGTGDRFGRQGAAQIAAFRKAREKRVDVAIVWNNSNREHVLIGTEPADRRFDPGMRQLVHVAFSVVAAMGKRYYEALDRHKTAVSRNVTANLWERHLVPLFIG